MESRQESCQCSLKERKEVWEKEPDLGDMENEADSILMLKPQYWSNHPWTYIFFIKFSLKEKP